MARSPISRNHIPQDNTRADINPHNEQCHPQIPISSIQKNRGPTLSTTNQARTKPTSHTISPSNKPRLVILRRRTYTPLTSRRPRTPNRPTRIRIHPPPTRPRKCSQPMAPTHFQTPYWRPRRHGTPISPPTVLHALSPPTSTMAACTRPRPHHTSPQSIPIYQNTTRQSEATPHHQRATHHTRRHGRSQTSSMPLSHPPPHSRLHSKTRHGSPTPSLSAPHTMGSSPLWPRSGPPPPPTLRRSGDPHPRSRCHGYQERPHIHRPPSYPTHPHPQSPPTLRTFTRPPPSPILPLLLPKPNRNHHTSRTHLRILSPNGRTRPGRGPSLPPIRPGIRHCPTIPPLPSHTPTILHNTHTR